MMKLSTRVGSVEVTLKLTEDERWPAIVISTLESLYERIGVEAEAKSDDVASIQVGKETEDGVVYKITFNDEVTSNLISRATDLIKEVAQKCIEHYQAELSTDRIDT